MFARLHDPVPAHVRYLEVFAAVTVLHAFRETHYPARQYAQAVCPVVFLAHLEQRLQAEADAEQGPACDQLADEVVQSGAAQFRDAVANRAHAGKHHAVCRTNDIVLTADDDALPAGNMFKGLGNGMQVAHAIVDDCNRGHNGSDRFVQRQRLPLVEGSLSPMAASASSAMRMARPKALKIVSAT